MRRLWFALIVSTFLAVGATPALAAAAAEDPFGAHVASMAPECPVGHGAHFAECVSQMARGMDCPHQH